MTYIDPNSVDARERLALWALCMGLVVLTAIYIPQAWDRLQVWLMSR